MNYKLLSNIALGIFIMTGFGLLFGAYTIGGFIGYKLYIGSLASFGAASLSIC